MFFANSFFLLIIEAVFASGKRSSDREGTSMLKALWNTAIVALAGLTLLTIPGTSEAQRRGGREGRMYDDSQSRIYTGPVQGSLMNPNDAGFILRLPDPNAEVWFQDHKTEQRGLVRGYESDRPLDPNKTYTFQIRARWMQNGQQMDHFASSGYVSDPNARLSFYPGTAQIQLRNPNDAGFIVRLPDPKAEVWFQDHKTQQSGKVRQFESESLNPNQTYTFEVRARWMENGQQKDQTRHVQARAGQSVTVDFTNSATERLPAATTPNQQQSSPPEQRVPRSAPK
jgi:uncharacterized protein (TIGR03000 family)